jgi:hypothetical protein
MPAQMMSTLGSRIGRGAAVAMTLAAALSLSACGGKKKKPAAGGGGPAKPDTPLEWKITALDKIGLAVERPDSWQVQPLGDGATQVDVTDGTVIVNLFKRPGRPDLTVLQTAPAGSAEDKLEWHEKLPVGAIWLLAQLPPGGGNPFGWTLTAKWSGLVDGDFEIECYALLAGSAVRTKYEPLVKRICASVTGAGAGGDGGTGDGGAK